MRLIPKNTKVKMQFYKGLTFLDIALGHILLALIALIVSSNLPFRFVIAFIVTCIFVPMFLSVGGEKIYMSVLYIVKHLFRKNKLNGEDAKKFFVHKTISDSCIKNVDDNFVGVVEIKPIEFRLLNGVKQNGIIDGTVAKVLESIGSDKDACIVRLEKPFCLDSHVLTESTRIQDVIRNREHDFLTQTEYEARMDILQDRITLLDTLNTENMIKYSAYYLVLFDKDQKNLISSLHYVKRLLASSSIDAHVLNDNELAEFIKLSIDGELFEPSQEKTLTNISVQKLEFKAKQTVINDKVLSHFVVTDYPLKVGNAWGDELFDIPNTKVVMKLKTIEKAKAVRRIDNAITELATQAKGKASKIIDKRTHIETLSGLLTRLQNDNESMFDVTLIITVYDEKGSNSVRKGVKRKLRELGLSFNEMFGRQQDAFLSSNIDTCDKIKISRGMPSTTVAACFPFVSNAIVDDKGIILGENKLPVLIDLFKRDDEHINSNMVIIGKSGSGKSYAAKNLLAHLASCDSKIFILDPENEYAKLADSLGGKILDVASAKFGKLNPFQVISSLDDENDDGTHNSFFAHLQFLEEFFKLILQGLNTDCFELVNKFILELYVAKVINGETDFSKLTPDNYPIMDDLAQLVEARLEAETDDYTKSCLKILVNYLAKFKSGGRNSALWNGASSFDAKENFVCFNFQKLLANKNNTIANAQMLLVLKWLENEVIKNRDYNMKNGTDRKVIVVIDEAHVFIDEKYPIALDFMYQLGKRIRKYSGMQIIITQNVKDFAGTAETARKSMAIINVSQYSLIFSLSPNDMSDLCTLYEKAGQINETESDNIVYNPRGCAFLISSPSSRTNIRIVATPFMQSLFNNEVAA